MARASATAVVALLLLAGACEDGDGRPDELTGTDGDRPAQGPIATIQGGVELPVVDPAALLAGDGLAFGTPLPSEQAAADAFVGGEVAQVLARRVYLAAEGRHLADLLVLTLDGTQIFDDEVLAAFERGMVAALGGGELGEVTLSARTVHRSVDAAGRSTLGVREGNQLVVVRAANEGDATTALTLLLDAKDRGAVGSLDPVTPLVALPADAGFVAVPGVAFTPFLPSEVEPAPAAPDLPGAIAVDGRYGVVAGERRTVVWSFAIDPAAYPTAEALAPALQALTSARAGGAAAADAAEVGGRVVLSATSPAGAPSAQVFRHQGLVLVVEGTQRDQVAAVTTAWIAALGPT